MIPEKLHDYALKMYLILSSSEIEIGREGGIVLANYYYSDRYHGGTKYVMIKCRNTGHKAFSIDYFKIMYYLYEKGYNMFLEDIVLTRRYTRILFLRKEPLIPSIDERFIHLSMRVYPEGTSDLYISISFDYLLCVDDRFIHYLSLYYRMLYDYNSKKIETLYNSNRKRTYLIINKYKSEKYRYPEVSSSEPILDYVGYDLSTDMSTGDELGDKAVSILRELVADNNSYLYKLLEYAFENIYYYIYLFT